MAPCAPPLDRRTTGNDWAAVERRRAPTPIGCRWRGAGWGQPGREPVVRRKADNEPMPALLPFSRPLRPADRGGWTAVVHRQTRRTCRGRRVAPHAAQLQIVAEPA